MTQSTATRRLVKSPPELWAELSSEDALGRHLAEFGEIKITRTDPDSTVAWEGDRISGTVQLVPTGWGTKVVLTATPEPDRPAAQLAAEAACSAEPAARGGAQADAPLAAPEDAVVIERPSTPAAAPPASESETEPPQSLLARLFGRRRPPDAPAAAIPAPPAPDPAPPAPAPSPSPVLPASEPPRPSPIPVPSGERAGTVLNDILDELGSANHRPFSRD